MHIEQVINNEVLYAIILRDSYRKEGISFLTSNELSQQLAYMEHPAGKLIVPHVHNIVQREVTITQEVLFIKKGKLRVDFYDGEKNYIESRVLCGGDTILLAGGGHGFEILEDLQMIEVKQGPYAGDADKTRFEQVSADKIKIVD
jgi:mannose-6-phosphate isomerase-like protein (cupin superfamily)